MADLLDWMMGVPPVPAPRPGGPAPGAPPGAPAPASAPARRGPADWLAGGRGSAPPAAAPLPPPASRREPEAPRGTVIQGGAGTTAEELGRRLWQDAGAVQDLEALLANPAQAPAATFSAPQPGTPGLLRRRDAAEPLPEVVRECYGAGNHVVCLAGVFPSIRRVWVTVDSSLFLWRSDRTGEIPLEYRGKEQAISAVGMVTPRRGVFWEAVQHLLIICTPLEISLLGVVLQGGGEGGGGRREGRSGSAGVARGAGDELEELSLQPLPMYCVPSNGIMMLCTASTRGGRVFLGGDDGHLYEVEYSGGEGWGQKRCRKVCHTSSVWTGLVGLVKGALAPVEQIAVDEERGVLYLRHRNSQLTVFDIGPDCKAAPKKAGECLNVPEACRAWGVGPHGLGKRLFGTTPPTRPGEISPAAIINVAPVPRSDSHRLHMVATTADGRRVYFSTTSSYSVWGGPTGPVTQAAKVSPRPTDLRVKMVRGSPVVPSVPSGSRMMVEYGFYREGLALLSHSRKGTGGGATSELVSCSRDLTAAADGGARRDFAEMVGSCDVEGVSCAIGEMTMPAVLLEAAPMQGPGAGPVPGSGGRSDLLLQHVLPPRRLVLLSNLGVEEIEKLRPIDVLAQMLREGSRDLILHFFKTYGMAEACAMCLILATPAAISDTAEAKELTEVFERSYGLPRSEAEAVRGALSCSAVVVEAARKVYEDAAFVGEPIEEPVKPAGTSTGGYGAAGATNGAPAETHLPKIHFSGAYEGLALYAARLVAPLWEHALMFERKAGDRVKVCMRLGAGTLRVLEERVRALEKYLHACECRRLASTPAFTSGGGRGYEAEPWGMQYAPGGQGYAQRQAAQKRQRVEVAAEREAKAASAMRVTLMRTSEALKILRLLLEHVGEDVSAIVDRLDSVTRGHLVRSSGAGGHGNFGLRARQQHYTTLRDLVTTEEGEMVVRGLIAALMARQMSVGRGDEVDELGRGLERSCPTFFRSEDRTFYDARLVLKRAQAAKVGSERSALVKQALASLLKVPSVVNLPAVVPELATLGCWEGVVELPLRASASADPSNLASRAGTSGAQARALREANYGLVTAELRRLAPSLEEVQLATSVSHAQAEAPKGLTPAQRAEAREKLLTIAFASRDRLFHEHVYAYLAEQGRLGREELARLRPPFLEEFLRARGGLPAGPGPIPGDLPALGPLAPAGVQALELLTELYGEGNQAAQVQLMLSQRKCGTSAGGTDDVTLEKRRQHLMKAVELMRGGGASLTVGGLGGGTVGVDYFETKLRVLDMQCELRDSLDKAARKAVEVGLPEVEVADLRRKSESLSESLLDLTDLYNDYAFPDQFWGLCLEMLHLAKYSDPLTIQDLWDKHLGSAATSGDLEGSNLAASCECAVSLGKKFWPNEALLPLQHIAGRLDEVAAGLWPEQATPATPDSTDRVVLGLLEATSNSAESLRRAYDSLLLRPSSHPALKLQHLRSLASLMGHMAKEVQGVVERGAAPSLLGSGTLRDVGSFTSLLERYALAARNLPVPGSLSGPVAVSFERLYGEVPAFADPLA